MKQEIMNTLDTLKKASGLPIKYLSEKIGLSSRKISVWRKGSIGSENKCIPKSHWITPEERKAVEDFKRENPFFGYVLLTWMMIDRDIAYMSPSSVYRILVECGLNNKWRKPTSDSKKTGFDQPKSIHEHWHTDISYINFKGSFVYLICVLDGFSRAVLSWSIATKMESLDVQLVLWDACEKWLGGDREKGIRLITDNGSQFSTKEFKQTLKEYSITNVRTSVNHPQSNGKIERFHGTIKSELIREIPKYSLEQVRYEVGHWIEHYNNVRLHSAIGYVAPMDVFYGRKDSILRERKEKLIEGKLKRKQYSESIKLDLVA
ncbi:IS3 family transposase [Leptospira levettii]|uniref:IS3 family transposase n=1 Tax=Leptospira levettii TaxID=2023178 RepID=UPI00223D9AEC|nr:IS3 family transposase [Leptospira levettii]MCW7520823.1 IS3 family transposase [Leptospira levettii]